MRTATETRGHAMKTRALISLLVAAIGLLALAAAAQAASPGWELQALTAPTNLPPEQSEVQRVTVEAEGGDFTLSRKSGEGEGTVASYGEGYLSYTGGSNVATFAFGTGGFEAGQAVISAGGKVEPGTVIEEVEGATITLSEPASSGGYGFTSAAGTLLSGVHGTGAFEGTFSFREGDAVSGVGIQAGTTVASVDEGAETITLSQPPTSGGSKTLIVSETTAPVAYNASAEVLQGALDALPGFPPETFAAEGGPGGDAGHPYTIAFGGSEYSNKDVEEFSADFSGLTGEHPYLHILTTVPGGAGTGEIGVFASNVGGEATSGEVTVEVGPLPAGISAPEATTRGGWSCSAGEPGQKVTCTGTELGYHVPEAVQPLEPANPVAIPVQVGPGAAASATVPVRVSGGEGGEATSQMPLVVSAEPAGPGIQAAWFGVFDANGNPATQAGGHPNGLANEIAVNTLRVTNGKIAPVEDLREVIADLPPGLLGDPLVTDRCPQSLIAPQGLHGSPVCNEAENNVGELEPRAATFAQTSAPFGIYNDVPAFGTAAQFGSKLVEPVQTLVGSVRSADDFGIRVTAPHVATFQKVFGAFTAFYGFPESAGGKPFFTNATDCSEQARQTPVARISMSTWQHPGDFRGAPPMPQTPVTGCDKLSFNPASASSRRTPTAHRAPAPTPTCTSTRAG